MAMASVGAHAMADFKGWLRQSRSVSPRGCNDICSRLRRLGALIDMTAVKSTDDLKVSMIRSELTVELTTSVRSQLKRAGTLYLEFSKECQESA